MRTNGAGRVEKVIKLPEEAFIDDFAVDAEGAVYAELTRPGTHGHTDLMVYAPDGTLVQTAPAPAGLCPTASAMLGVTDSSGRLAFAPLGSESRPLAQVTLRRLDPVITLALPDGRVAVVEKTAAVVHLVDLQRGTEAPVMPRVPEMQWLATLAPGDHMRNVAFGDGVASPDGRIFLLLGHYKSAEGAAVVSFHMNGNLFETIRYRVPRLSEGAEFMVPSYLTVYSGDTMVMVSGDGKVAEYPP
ncbi:MAG: hypothetical protein ACLP59_07110 [Bryobacteraceae bacterium]